MLLMGVLWSELTVLPTLIQIHEPPSPRMYQSSVYEIHSVVHLVRAIFFHFGGRFCQTSKLCDAGLREWNSAVTGEFPSQRAVNAEIFLLDDGRLFQMIFDCFILILLKSSLRAHLMLYDDIINRKHF